MPIVLRRDSDGRSHQVWAQEQPASCAVASIWMARNQARQMTIHQGEWDLAWQIYGRVIRPLQYQARPPAGMSLDPVAISRQGGLRCAELQDQDKFEHMFAFAGTSVEQVVSALSADGLRVWASHFSPDGRVQVVQSSLSDRSPAIVLLGWYDRQGIRRGGHFIVASRVTSSGRVVYLDPDRGGELHELPGAGPCYRDGGRFQQVLYLAA